MHQFMIKLNSSNKNFIINEQIFNFVKFYDSFFNFK